MFEEEHGPEGVGAKRQKRIVVVNLRRGFLGEKDSWDGEGEVEVVFAGREDLGELFGGLCDDVFI